jgi:hypothetical protein
MDDSQKVTVDNSFANLMTEFGALSTFAEAATWGRRAEAEIERIAGLVRAVNMDIAQQTQALDRLKYEQSKKLVGRLFGGGSNEEKELAQQIEKYKQDKSALENMLMRLQDAVDFTPGSPEQQSVLIKELRQKKKEIQEKKREITTVMRIVRSDTQPNDELAYAVFSAATLDRRKMRYAREAELLPQETTSASYTRQIAQLDRDIQWVEKFTQ